MEVSAVSTQSNKFLTLKHSTTADDGKTTSEKGYRSTHTNGKPNLTNASTFVNHAAIAWHEERRKWVGDKSQRPPRKTKDPIIRPWSIHTECQNKEKRSKRGEELGFCIDHSKDTLCQLLPTYSVTVLSQNTYPNNILGKTEPKIFRETQLAAGL